MTAAVFLSKSVIGHGDLKRIVRRHQHVHVAGQIGTAREKTYGRTSDQNCTRTRQRLVFFKHPPEKSESQAEISWKRHGGNLQRVQPLHKRFIPDKIDEFSPLSE